MAKTRGSMMHQSRNNKPGNSVGSESVPATFSLADVTGPVIHLRKPYVPSEELSVAAESLRNLSSCRTFFVDLALCSLRNVFSKQAEVNEAADSSITKMLRAVWLLPRRPTWGDVVKEVESARSWFDALDGEVGADITARFKVASLMHSEGGGANAEARSYVGGLLEQADRIHQAMGLIKEKGLSICDRLDLSLKPDELQPLREELRELLKEHQHASQL